MSRAQAATLARLAGVARVESNDLVHALNDSAQASFGVSKARLDAGVDGDGDASTYSAADLVAAVIDSGIDTRHLDLDDGKVIAFANCLFSPCSTPAPLVVRLSAPSGRTIHVRFATANGTARAPGDLRDSHLLRGENDRVRLRSRPGRSSKGAERDLLREAFEAGYRDHRGRTGTRRHRQ